MTLANMRAQAVDSSVTEDALAERVAKQFGLYPDTQSYRA
jgi:hypothetical protein